MSPSDTAEDASAATNTPGPTDSLAFASADTLLQTMPLGVLALAADGTVAVLNPAAEALWGVPAAAVLGHAPAQVQPAVLPPELVQALAEAALTAGPYWLPHTQQWVTLRTAPAAEGRRWVYWDNITAHRQTETALRSSQERQAFLVRLGDALRPLLDAAQVQAVAARLLGQHLHANQVHYGETQGDDVVISQGYGDGLPAMTGRFRSVDFGERLTATHRAGIVQVIRDIETDEANTEAERQVLRQARIGAYITVPLVKQGQWVATLAVHSLSPRPWNLGDVQLVEDVAERTWAAVERAHAEEARRESEEKYRAIFNSINEGFSLLDIQFNEQGEAEDIIIRDANPAQSRIDGMRALIGKRVREFLPDLELKWIQRYGRVAQTGEPAHFEDWSEATQRWYEVDASRVGEADSTLVAIVYNDISERKQAEKALEKAHERLQLAMTAGRIFSFEMHPATRALELSDNVDLVMGFPLPDHIDSTFELIHPEDLEPTVALINGAIESRGSYASEYRLVNPANGEVVWFHSQAAFTRSNASSEWCFVGIAQNITESKQAEEALRESEAKYRTLFNSIDEGYYLLEVIFDEHGEATDVLYLDANPAAIRMSGGDRRGKRLREVGNYEAYWYELYGRVARTGVGERTERFSSTAGIWVDTYTFKVGEAGNRVATVFQDVTERKRREANQAFLAELSNEFTRAATVDGIMQRVSAKIGAYLQVVSVVFADVDETLGQVTVSHGWVQTGTLSIVGQRYRLEEYLTPEFSRLSRAGELFVVRDTQTDPRTDAALYAALQIRAWVVVPFHHHGEWRQYLTAYDAQVRDWRPDEVELFRELSDYIFPRLERARTEEALRASEAQFQKAFSISTVGQLFFTLDGSMTAANPAFLRMSGYRSEALLTLNWEVLTAPEFWDITAVAAGGLADYGETAPYEKQFVRPDGSRWWGLCAPIRLNGHGPAAECMAFISDITERKQAEEVVQQSEARQAYLLDLSDALRSVLDAAEMQATAAHTAMEYFQADRCYYCEIAGDTVTIRRDAARPGLPSVAAEYSLSTMPIFRAMLQERQPVVVADAHTSTVMDDSLKALCLGFGIIAYINVPVIKNGEQVGMLCLTQGTPREWTALETALVQETAERTWAAVERAQAEEALRDSEALLQKAFSIDTVGQLYFTLDGGMTAANQAFVRMSGCSQEALLTTNWEVLTAPEFWDITIIHAGELAERGETTPYEKQMVRPDGSRWWALCAPTRLKGEGPTAQCMEFIVDISERKQAEEQLRAFTASLEQQVTERTQALRESSELLQSVFDTSLISMSVLRAVRNEAGILQDFRIAIANQELERETGRTDLEGKLYFQEYPGIKQTGLYDLILGVLETGEPAGLEYYYGHEGFDKWYHCQFVKLDDGVVASNLDITPRKLAEEKSREQAHFIARVNETLPDLLLVTELASGQVLYVNRNPDEAPGFEREKMLNISPQAQTDLLGMHPDDAALLPDYFARAATLADHEITTASYRAKLNTDHWRWFQVRGSVLQRDPATGAATQLLSVAQDVTARKEAELQQAKAYQLLQQSEEVASLGSWDYDRSTGKFLWSAGMYRLFGLPPGSPIRPETYLDFVVAEDRAVAERIVQGLITSRTGFEETLRIQVGEVVKTVRVKAAGAFDAAGEPLRMLGVDLDISEVQRLEADNLHLRLTQQQALFGAVLEAEETERRRMAESLHNGLGQILYAAKLQLNQLQSSQLQYNPVPAALHRADQLLADAIRQTRTLSHELVPTVLTEFGLSAALLDICRSLRGPHLRFECTVELDAQQPLPQALQVAVYRMAQELAQNVVKHARATDASLALETVPGFVLLRVEDNGVGFATPPAPGTGIGLRTIRDRVTLLGGTVDLGSSPKFGTYVRIRFPLPTIPTSAIPSA